MRPQMPTHPKRSLTSNQVLAGVIPQDYTTQRRLPLKAMNLGSRFRLIFIPGCSLVATHDNYSHCLKVSWRRSINSSSKLLRHATAGGRQVASHNKTSEELTKAASCGL